MATIVVDLVILFKSLADETRLRCVLLLIFEGELCVCEFCYALNISQPKISRHLALLRNNNLLLDRKKGQWVYYRINPDLPSWTDSLFRAVKVGTLEEQRFQEDKQRLAAMSDRPNRCTS